MVFPHNAYYVSGGSVCNASCIAIDAYGNIYKAL